MIARLKRPLALGVCVAVATGLAASVVLADATIIADERYMELSGDATDTLGSNYVPDTEYTPDFFAGPFDGTAWYDTIHSPTFAAEAWAQASQVSTLAGPTTFTSLTASGTASIDGDTDFFDDFSSAQAHAESNFELDFTIDVPHLYTFAGSLDKGSTGTLVRALLEHADGTDVFYKGDDGSFNDSGELPAGSYKLWLTARGFRYVSGGASFDTDASFDNVSLSLTIPEPVSLSMLALGALLLRRRSR